MFVVRWRNQGRFCCYRIEKSRTGYEDAIYVGDQAKQQQMQLVQVAASLKLQLKSSARATRPESHMFDELTEQVQTDPKQAFVAPWQK